MLNTLWRAAIFAALLASALLFPLQWTRVTQAGTFGLWTDFSWANAPSITPRVAAVDAGSPAERAGAAN